MATAQQLAAFTDTFSQAPPSVPLLTQLSAACATLDACASVARACQPTPRDTYLIASTARLVFGAGRQALLALVQARQAARASLAVAPMAGHQLLEDAVQVQLQALGVTIGFLHCRPEHAAALVAFAGSTGRPEVFLPWLATVAAALEGLEGAHLSL